MTLKRSISQRFKNTLEKTKRIVSPSASSMSTAATSGSIMTSSSSSNIDNISTNSANSATSYTPSILNIKQSSISTIINHSDDSNNNKSPTLLYSSKIRSNSIRRQSSQPKYSLDIIDTSMASTIPIQIPNTSMDSDIEIINPNINTDSILSDHQTVLLPTDPIDKSIPPFASDRVSTSIDRSYEKPSFQHLNSGSSYSVTHSTSLDESSTTTSTSTSPVKLFKHDFFTQSTNHDVLVQNKVNPIFTKSNQIDHLDKHLDVGKNDLLADQMALNILHDISEEGGDELARFRAEIRLI